MPDIERKQTLQRRRELRATASMAERLLWDQLRQKQLGFKFRWQHSLEGYIVDFYCLEANLVVEVDGEQHSGEEAIDYDKKRDAELMKVGNMVLRFAARTVCENLEGVCLEIRKWCEVRSGKTPP